MPTRVLLVEDSPTQAEALKLLLEQHGYVVTGAASGEEALRLVPGGQFDLVLSDIVMPGIHGYEVCRRIKTDLGLRDLPVILLTVLGDPLDIVRGLECGADNYVTKPYEPEKLLGRIRLVLDTKALRRRVKPRLGVTVSFLGRQLDITSEKEQILDLLIATFEDVVRTNDKLRASQAQLVEAHAQLETYSRQMAVQAQVSAEKYWTLMQHATDAIFVTDPSGRILESNARAAALAGMKLDDLLGRPFTEFVLGDEVEYVRVQFAKLPTVRRLEAADIHLRHADGHLVCTDLVASLVPADPHPLVFVVARDVGQRNRFERQAVEQEKLALMGQLLAGVAHEINNPISYVLANLEQLEGEAQPIIQILAALRSWITDNAPAEERRRFDGMMAASRLDHAVEEVGQAIRDASDGAKRIREIVRDLKTLAHPDGEAVARVNLNAVIESAIHVAYGEIKYRAALERDLGELPEIIASPGRLTQVFLNLLLNAAQAIEEGDPAAHRIRVRSRREGQWLRVDVEDTGRGIPPEVLPKIFESFFTTKPVGTGTGLGLSISLGIVRDLGGDIKVRSAPGQGTTVTVLLSADTGKQLAAREAAAPVAAVARKLLLVDDESYILRAYGRVLGKHHEMTAALGGRQAIEVLERTGGNFDAVVCDLMMPDVDGIDLHGWVKERFPDLEHRMIFVTGGAATLRAREFLATLSAPWLEKPFEMEQLLHTVAEVAGSSVG
ncbi:MAG: response regulator [Gemmatimonadetes bacterium]|nr:response regulator [Gemmatimonadota bacterium]